jgi:tetratricopeptide (TPR) repeat protein
VIDSRRDHSFRVPRPDLSAKLGTPNACNDCHTRVDETFQWAAGAVRKWYGEKRPDDPHWAPAFAAGRAVSPDGDKLLAELANRKTAPFIVRATAVDLLVNYRGADSEATRRQALRDGDPLVRLAAVRAVSADLEPALAALLAAKVNDSILGVRVAAAARLAYMSLEHVPQVQRRAFERAFAEFLSAQELSLDHAGGHLTLGALDRAHGRVDDAIAHFKAAIRLEPYMTGARSELASLLQESGGIESEIRQLRQEEADLMERDARLAPENAEIYYRLGLLRFLLGQLDEAQSALIAACDRAPQNYEFLMALALLHERRYQLDGTDEQFNAAVLTLKKMHELQSADPRAKQILGRMLEMQQSRHGGPANSQ